MATSTADQLVARWDAARPFVAAVIAVWDEAMHGRCDSSGIIPKFSSRLVRALLEPAIEGLAALADTFTESELDAMPDVGTAIRAGRNIRALLKSVAEPAVELPSSGDEPEAIVLCHRPETNAEPIPPRLTDSELDQTQEMLATAEACDAEPSQRDAAFRRRLLSLIYEARQRRFGDISNDDVDSLVFIQAALCARHSDAPGPNARKAHDLVERLLDARQTKP